MTKLQVDTIQDSDATGAVDIKHGYTVNGASAEGLTQGIYTGSTEPSSPSNGDLWKSDFYLYIYMESDWHRIVQGSDVSTYGETTTWYGDRAVYQRSGSLEYFDITSSGNAADFGDFSSTLTQKAQGCAGGTRGVFMGSSSTTGEDIQYITTSTLGNSTAFGDLVNGTNRYEGGAASNGTIGLLYGTRYSTDIESITIATTGNATDFGDCAYSAAFTNAYGDSTRAVKASAENTNNIEYVAFATAGNGTDFGDMVRTKAAVMCGGDETYMLMGGGWNGSTYYNDIDYITIQTTGNAADFGNLTASRASSDATQNATRTVFMGGTTSGFASNVIDYVTTTTTGNATDLGDLVIGAAVGACSGAAS